MAINLLDLDFDRHLEGDLDLVESMTRRLVAESVPHWQGQKLLRRSESGCFAIVVRVVGGLDTASLCDRPEDLIDFTVWHGEKGSYAVKSYVANAVRKMRATARTGLDTLVMQQRGVSFENVTDGTRDNANMLPWGEFPYGGAVLRGSDDKRVIVGMSGCTQEEDHIFAGFLADFFLDKYSRLSLAA